jgi:hypothetical protein
MPVGLLLADVKAGEASIVVRLTLTAPIVCSFDWADELGLWAGWNR